MKFVLKRLVAMLLCLTTAVAFMSESVSAIGNIAGILSTINSGIAPIALESDNAVMHVIVRNWHAIDSNGNSYSEAAYDQISIYITKNDDDDGFTYTTSSDSGANVNTVSKDYLDEIFDESNGKLNFKPMPNSSLEDESGNKLEEEFEGYSVAAGHAATDIKGDTLTITYDPNIHLVKVHVFYKSAGVMVDGKTPDDTVAGSDEEYLYTVDEEEKKPEYDTGTVFLYNDEVPGDHKKDDPVFSKTDKTKLARTEAELPEGYTVGEGDKTVRKTKYYNNQSGLHTDKTASVASEDGRTFKLDLESWFVGNNIADVGLVLDASGSMAFTSENLDKIKLSTNPGDKTYVKEPFSKYVDEGTADSEHANLYDFPADAFLTAEEVDKILNKNYTDNSKLGYSDYTYYIFDSRSDTNEYVPIGYYDGGDLTETTTTVTTEVKFPKEDKLIGYYPFEQDDYTINKISKDHLKKVLRADPSSVTFDVAGATDAESSDPSFLFNKDHGYSPSYRSSAGADEAGLLLDVSPSGNKYTISFTLRKVDKLSAEGSSREDAFKDDRTVDEMIYIGPSSVDTNGNYFHIFREQGSSASRLRAREKDDSKNVVNVNTVFENKDHQITIVFNNNKVEAYKDGVKFSDEQPRTERITKSLGDKIYIILNGLQDTYNGACVFIDDLFVYDAVLTSSEVKTLYDYIDKGTSSESNEVTDYYNDTAMFNKAVNDLDADQRAGWYYVNSQSAWEDEVLVANTSKKYYELQKAEYKKNDEKINPPYIYAEYSGATPPAQTIETILNENYGVSGAKYYQYTSNGKEPMRFFLDKEGFLCCFYSSGTATNKCGWSYVYEKKDIQRIKAETLQHALGMFISRLDESSPDSRVSAVRFSSNKIPSKDYDKLVMLDWTEDPNVSMPMFNFVNGDGKDIDKGSKSNSESPLEQYNYVLTGGTTTASGLQAFWDNLIDSKVVKKDGAKKYLIIFTDGKDTDINDALKNKTINDINVNAAIEGSDAYELASLIRNEGYTIFSVMLHGGSVEDNEKDNFDDYDIALRFLASLTGETDEDGNEVWKSGIKKAIIPQADGTTNKDKDDVDTYSQVYASHDSAGLARIFSEEIVGRIADSLSEYTVKDYIDPRFDLVDSDGSVWNLKKGGSVEIKKADGTEGSSFTLDDKGKEINLSNSILTRGEGDKALLKYDSDSDLYYLEWVDQIIPGSSKGLDRLPVWNAEVKIRAKDDFIGGNAVMSNGNATSQNFVYSKADGDKSSGTSDAEDKRESEEKDLYPSKGFPRTTVNVEVPHLKIEGGKQLIFLGEKLTNDEVAEKLGETIYDYLIKSAEADDLHDSHWYWEYLKRYAKSESTSFENILKSIVDAASTPGYVDFPYYYISDEDETNQTGGDATGGGDKHILDRLGTLRFAWKDNQDKDGTKFEPYPTLETLETVLDLKKRCSALEVYYYPITTTGSGLPNAADGSEVDKDGNETTVENRTEQNKDIYGSGENDYAWNPSYKFAAGSEEIYNSEKLHDSGDYLTEIVSGDIVFNMIVPEDVVNYLNDHYPNQNISYTANLVKDGDTLGTFTASLTAVQIAEGGKQNAAVHFVITNDDYGYVKDYGLPMGDYTVTSVSHTQPLGITFGDITVKEPGADMVKVYEPKYEETAGIKTAEDYRAEAESLPAATPVTTTLSEDLLNALLAKVSGNIIQIGTSRGSDGDYRDARYGYAEVNAILNTGNLSISKTVEGLESANEDYKFTIEQQGAEPYISGTFNATLSSGGSSASTDSVTFDNGKATVTIKKGQTITIEGLPVGAQFKVAEDKTNLKYNYTTTNGEQTVGIPNGSTVAVDVANKVDTGDLTISKKVTGEGTPTGDKSDTFTFDIELDSGPETSKNDTYSASKTPDDGSVTSVTFTGGKASVTLKGGESLTIEGLPAGAAYKVTEQSSDGYDVTYSGGTEVSGGNGRNVTITKDSSVTVSAENRFKSGSLEISKTVVGSDGVSAGALSERQNEDSFEVKIVFKNGDDNVKLENATFSRDCSFDETGKFYTVSLKHGENITISGIPAGLHYSVTEILSSTQMVYYESSVSSDEGVIEDKDDKTVIITNTYTPAPITVSIPVTKKITGSPTSDSTFTFTLTGVKNGEVDPPMPETELQSVSITVGKGKDKADAPVSFGAITFTKAGIYTYTVTENTVASSAFTYDTEPVTVAITIDDENGKLVVESYTVTKNGENTSWTSGAYPAAPFTNIYNTVKKSISGTKAFVGDYTGSEEFTFTLTPIGDAPMPDGASAPVTATAKVGKLDFTFGDITFPAIEGEEYKYEITEQAGKNSHIAYDSHKYYATVKITKSGAEYDATFEYSWKDGGEEKPLAGLTITNTYTPAPVSITFSGTKSLEGREWNNEDTFDVKIEKVETTTTGVTSTVIGAKTVSKGNETYTFGSYTLSKTGEYKYRISEAPGSIANVTYSKTVYEITVNVADDNGVLKASYEVTGGENNISDSEKTGSFTVGGLNFTNVYTYTPPIEPAPASIAINKTFTADGATTENGLDFNFEVKCVSAVDSTGKNIDFDGEPWTETVSVAKGENSGTTNVEFEFDQPGVYTYKIKEIKADYTEKILPGAELKTSEKEITLIITVTQNDGVLTANADHESVEFKNTYIPPKPVITISKSQEILGVAGNTVMPEDTVCYNLTVTNSSVVDAKNVVIVDNVDSRLIVDAVSVAESGGTQNGNILTWTKDIAAGETITVTFNVKIPNVEANTTFQNSATANSSTSETVELKEYVGSLTVSKTITGNMASAEDEFNFTLEIFDRSETTVVLTIPFTLRGGEHKTFNNLPDGAKYIVAEINDHPEYTATVGGEKKNTAEGYINKDSSASVSFNNDYNVNIPTGSLTVKKTVAGPNAEIIDNAFEFTYSLTLPMGLNTSEFDYAIKEWGYNELVTVESGQCGVSGTFSLKHGQCIVISGLPVGTTYEVTENAGYEDRYIVESYKKTGSIELDVTGAVENADAAFVNTERVGKLTVSKTTISNKAGQYDLFNFHISLFHEDGTPATEITGMYGDMYFDGGEWDDSLADGESRTAEGLPVGYRYTVEEINVTDYEPHLAESDSVSGATLPGIPMAADAEGSIIASGQISDTETASAAFVNIRKVNENPGDLTISKIVTGDGDPGQSFNFTLDFYRHETHGGPKEPALDINITGQKAIGGVPTGETCTVESGHVEFTLRNGESLSFTGVPENIHYEISEDVPDGYTVSISDTGAFESAGLPYPFGIMPIDEPAAANVTSGDVMRGERVFVTFTNHIEPKKKPDAKDVTLTVEKTISEYGATELSPLTFYFDAELISATPSNGGALDSLSTSVTVDTDEKSGSTGLKFTFTEEGVYTYRISERNVDYTNSIPEGSTLETDADPVEVVFTVEEGVDGELTVTPSVASLSFENTFTPAPKEPELSKIKLTKTVVDSKDNVVNEGTFEFTVTLTELSSYNEYGFENGVQTVTVTVGKETEITVPKGAEYEIVEVPKDGYTDLTKRASGIADDDEITVQYKNLKEDEPEPVPELSKIKLTKTVVDSKDNVVNEGTFEFTVTLTELSSYNEYGFENGVQTVTVTVGKETEITVPKGAKYEITEVPKDGYTDLTKRASGTADDDEITVQYKNLKEDEPEPVPETGSLRLRKILSSGNLIVTGGRTFVFDIELDANFTGTAGDVEFVDGKAVVKLKGGEEILMTGLPAGAHYTVTEQISAGYTLDAERSSGLTGVISKDSEATAVAFNVAVIIPPHPSRPVPEIPTVPEPEPDNIPSVIPPTEAGRAEEDNPETGFSFGGILGLLSAIAAAFTRKKKK